jgi:hypothetical protein
MKLAMTFLIAATMLRADTLTFRNGSSVEGTWVAIDLKELSFMVDGAVKTYRRAEIARVTFGKDAPASNPSTAAPERPAEKPVPTVVEIEDPAAPTTVKIGASVAQLIAAMGQPKSIVDGGAKKVYVYSNLKVTIVDGKVSGID